MASVKLRHTRDGRRYDVRYRDPAGKQRMKTYRRKVDADRFAATVEADKLRGTYVDPRAGRERFRTYAERWLAAQTFDRSSREAVASRLQVQVYPVLGDLQLGQVKPSTIQAWLRSLDGLAPAYCTVLFAHVSAVFSAAVDDELILKNPCSASSVRPPRRLPRKLVPWPIARVTAVAAALPDRFRVTAQLGAGLGLRQGEILGFSPADVDPVAGEVLVARQVKLYRGGCLAFALPKGGKTRTVPLAGSVAAQLRDHLHRFPARPVTLPWGDPGGEPVTVELVVTTTAGDVVQRNWFNASVWRPALVAAGIEPGRTNGCHALRHHFASVLLDGGESIKAVSEYLGHADAGFTLRTYTHLMPSSAERTRKAVDAAWAGVRWVCDDRASRGENPSSEAQKRQK